MDKTLKILEGLKNYCICNADSNTNLLQKHKDNRDKRLHFRAASMTYEDVIKVIDEAIEARLLDPQVQTEEENRIDIIGQNGNDGDHYF